DPLKAAELARDARVRIHAIAFGGNGGSLSVFGLPVPLPGGGDEIDEATLARIAGMTGGKAFRARDTEDLAGIYAEIDRIAPRRAPGAPAAGALSVAAGRRARLRVAVAARAQAGGGMSALHFLRPEWLWLLLALPPLAWWLRRDAARTGPWPREVDAHLLPHLLAPVRGLRGGGRAWLVSPLLALAIVALAGPSWSRVQQPLWQSRAPLVLALDLSGAMLAGDLPPSRLARA